MKLLIAAAVMCVATSALAADPVTNSAVEARLDALEKINVTSAKPARADSDAKDAQVDAILDQAARTEQAATSATDPSDH